jgi:hypothetical protein
VLALKGHLKKHQTAIPAMSWTTRLMASSAHTLAGLLKAEADALGVSATAVAKRPSPPPKSEAAGAPVSKGQITLDRAVGYGAAMAPWLLLAGGVTAGAVWWKRRQKGKR